MGWCAGEPTWELPPFSLAHGNRAARPHPHFNSLKTDSGAQRHVKRQHDSCTRSPVTQSEPHGAQREWTRRTEPRATLRPLSPPLSGEHARWYPGVRDQRADPDLGTLCQNICADFPYLCLGLFWIQLQLVVDWTCYLFLVEEKHWREAQPPEPSPGFLWSGGARCQAESYDLWFTTMGKKHWDI